MHSLPVILCVILLSSSVLGLEYNKQRYNPTSDFLQHEGGAYHSGPKSDPLTSLQSSTAQNGNANGKRDYEAQYPQLGPHPTTKTPLNNPNSGKRDYVAPQFPKLPSPTPIPSKSPTTSMSTANTPSTATVNKPNSGKRDYVAPQFPQLPSPNPNLPKSPTNGMNPQNAQSSNDKRDYVSPQYPTVKPVLMNNRPSTGKVKDLIHYYDNQNSGQNTPQKIPSYSNILQGSTNKRPQGSSSTTFTQTTTKSPTVPTPTKPLSLSDILSGSKSPSTPLTTHKPSTRVPTNTATTRPVLPSSIVNKNQNSPVVSSGPATDLELQILSEELLRKDINNAAKFVTVNYQEKTTSYSADDRAPGPLLTISPEAWNIPTIQKFIPLLDNYERDTLVNEYVTPMERNEENSFMDSIMSTSVIRHLMNFLKDKGIVTPDPRQQRDFLKQLWFSLYSRGRGKISSSGFEHIFVSELKNGEVSGLHNWIYFAKEETANRINYLGYLKYVQLNDKGVVLKYHFNQQGVDKPVDSMFIGTSPELEIALYTLCFATRADKDCKLKLANNDVDIVSHTFRYRSKNLIGSAYPQI